MHSPTLDSVLMVEQAIQEHSGKLGKYQLWKALPRKMMYQTFQKILTYLEQSHKITTHEKKIVWLHRRVQVAKRVTPKQIHYVM